MTLSIQATNSKNSDLSVFSNSIKAVNTDKNLVENKKFAEKLKEAQRLRSLEKKTFREAYFKKLDDKTSAKIKDLAQKANMPYDDYKTAIELVVEAWLSLRGEKDRKSFQKYDIKGIGESVYIIAGDKKASEKLVDKDVVTLEDGIGIAKFDKAKSEKALRDFFKEYYKFKQLNRDLIQDIKTNKPYTHTLNLGLDKSSNSISFVPDLKFISEDGTIFSWKDAAVKVINSKDADPIEKHQAQMTAKSLNFFTRIANKEMTGWYFNKHDSSRVKKVLQSMGIDLSKDFFVNGKRFWLEDGSGKIEWTYAKIAKENHINFEDYSFNDKLPPGLKNIS